MARQKSEFLSALGVLFEIVKSLIEEVKSLGGNDEHIRRIGTDKKLRSKLAELIVESGKAIAGVSRVMVNYSDPRWQEIRTGDYTYVDSALKPEHFPIQGKGQAEVSFSYLKYNHEPTTQEVLSDVEADSSIRRPDRAETESFLNAHSEEKDKYPVIGLCGSVVGLGGNRDVAYVSASESRRSLRFGGLDYRWDRDCRFLVVRKSS